MGLLKTFVIGMAVLIVAGTAALVWALLRQMEHRGHLPAPAAATAAPSLATAARPFTVDVAIPAGSRVEQMVAAGDRVLVRLAAGGNERILVLDPKDGRVTGTINLRPADPVPAP